jgi:glycosyltransferase involved in cell wall biosynthesis
VWRVRRRLGGVLAAGGHDLVVSHGCWPHAIAAPVVRRARRALVFWAHGIQTGGHWLERWAARHRPDWIIANSRATQASMSAVFGPTPGDVLYVPVDPPEVSDRAAARRALRDELGASAEDVIILMASRLEPLKGHGLLVRALKRLADLGGWTCWIAGGAQRPEEQDYLGRVKSWVATMGLEHRVRFLGQRTDVPRLLAAADIHCQPNIGPESFGIVFIEALYARLPVVTMALGGAVEIVDQTCGVLVPPGDADGLTATLRTLILEPDWRARLGAAGPARAAALCSPGPQLSRLESMLGELRCPA